MAKTSVSGVKNASSHLDTVEMLQKPDIYWLYQLPHDYCLQKLDFIVSDADAINSCGESNFCSSVACARYSDRYAFFLWSKPWKWLMFVAHQVCMHQYKFESFCHTCEIGNEILGQNFHCAIMSPFYFSSSPGQEPFHQQQIVLHLLEMLM